jgi:hypothetical protein
MLQQILEKLGIRSIDDLKPAERETWRQWGEILARHELTTDDIKAFLTTELARANGELHSFDNSDRKEMFYKAYAVFSETLLKAISAPQREKDQLRDFLRKKYEIE